jgi:hypothetical protein
MMNAISYEEAIELLVCSGRPLGDIEDAIEATPLSTEHKAALWLLAWSYPAARARRLLTRRTPAGRS